MNKLSLKEKNFITALKETCKRHNMSMNFDNNTLGISSYSEDKQNWKVTRKGEC